MNRWIRQLGRRARNLLPGLCLAAISTIVSLSLLEIVLRAEIDRLPIVWANELGSGYAEYADGIYRYDPDLNMLRMRPNYEREMFFNGYHWHHRTDSMGFRNPTDRERVDIVLLGDSMIYGHGVEEEATVRNHLERLLGRPVANLGVQGAAMDYEYQILRHDAVKLRPRYVLIFFINNDITDVEGRVREDEERRFLALPVSDHTTVYYDPNSPHPDHPVLNLYVVKTGWLLKRILKAKFYEFGRDWHGGTTAAAAASSSTGGSTAADAHINPSAPSGVELKSQWILQPPFAGDPRMQLALQFHLRAILKSDDFARRHGMRMSYIFIGVPLAYDSLYEEINADFCRANGIDFFSLRPVLQAAEHAGKQVFLPGDGHFTDAGAAVTAQALVDHFHLRDRSAWR